ncbi:MAG: hypothetical protein ACTSVO_05565 [Candidatus Heimdallarchaeaceae archaeon]
MVDELERQIKRMFAPIVVWKGYEDMVTEEMKIRIRLERLLTSEETATDHEAMVYLHTASLAVPFSREWYDIYTFLFSKYYPEQAKRIDVYREQINEMEQRELSKLKKWIYEKQMNK